MKLCISVGLLKVKVGFVWRVMKTLFEFMLAEPIWTSPAAGEGVGAGGEGLDVFVGDGGFVGPGGLGVVGEGLGVGVLVGAGVGVGPEDRQIEGCPLQANPIRIWQLRHPGEELLPVSQVSPPTISPSPQMGLQTPWLFAENPRLAQAIHWVADRQVLQVELQAVHPRLLSKYCPSGQATGLRTSRWQTP